MADKKTKYGRNILIAVISIGLFALVAAVLYTGSISQKYKLQPGDTSPFDIVAPRGIPDRDETQRRATRAAADVKEVMLRSELIVQGISDKTERLFELVREERQKPPLLTPTPAPPDSTVNQDLNDDLTTPYVPLIDRKALADRIKYIVERELGIEMTADDAMFFAVANSDRIDRVEDHVQTLSAEIMTERIDQAALNNSMRQKIADLGEELVYERNDLGIIERCLAAVLEPNIVYDAMATENARLAAYNRVLNNPVMIEKGTRIVAVDAVITEDVYNLLVDLDLIDSGEFDSKHLGGILLLLILVITVAVFTIRHFEKDTISSLRDLIVVLLSILVPLLVSATLTRHAELSPPVYFAAVLIATYFGFRASLLLSFSLAILILPMTNFNPIFLAVAMVGSLVAALFAKGIIRKDHYALIILATSGTSALTALAFSIIQKEPWADLLLNLGYSAVSGALSVIAAIGLMPLFEMVFNVVSPMRLIELSQPGHPLLRRLFVEAPGTSQHSMMVANLADSAAVAIGANALLARVGSYYHDIGKLEEPMMFTENQDEINPHDELPPEQSARIILGHPDAGLRIGRRYRLPKPILDIIHEHHGTTEQVYFLHKAQEIAARANQPAPDPHQYRYPSNVPSSREAAIVMLADSVEAAMKSTNTTDGKKAEQLIRRIIKNKNEQDQLVRSGLSFRDVELITAAFLQVYAGHFHERVQYPK